MGGMLLGGQFLIMDHLLIDLGLQPGVLLTAAVCAVLGAVLLSRYTVSLGTLTLPINFCALFVGGAAANMIANVFQLPLVSSFDQPLLISIAGMAVTSIIMLVFMARDRLSN